MTTSQASRVFGIPYNSLLMYVRGKYGKSLRLDVLKKNTPAANDDLNVIGNSRSTPKEKAGKREDNFSHSSSSKDRARKPSQESSSGLSGLFPFDQPSFNPFNNGLLFPPPGEPFGLLGLAGLPPADPRIKDLMQTLQAQHSALSQTERIKEEAFSDTKENNENMSRFQAPFHMQEEAREKALQALLRRAREDCEKSDSSEPKNADDKDSTAESKDEEDSSTDRSMDTSIEIPQIAIKPVEVLPAPITSKSLELNIPSAASEISAQ